MEQIRVFNKTGLKMRENDKFVYNTERWRRKIKNKINLNRYWVKPGCAPKPKKILM